jgi:hypothetical protein
MLICFSLSGIEKDSLSVGLSWNHRSKYMINGEIYLLLRGEILSIPSDFKTGVTIRNYSLHFDGVENLQASSVGLVGEQTIYPFKKILFLGYRFDISADWLSQASKDKIKSERQYEMPLCYYNFLGYLEAGVNLKLINRFNLKLSVMPGVEDRGITNSFLITGTSNGTNVIKEDKNNYFIQFNLSIEFKLQK